MFYLAFALNFLFFVCLDKQKLAILRKNHWSELHENYTRESFSEEELIKFRKLSASGIRVQVHFCTLWFTSLENYTDVHENLPQMYLSTKKSPLFLLIRTPDLDWMSFAGGLCCANVLYKTNPSL